MAGTQPLALLDPRMAVVSPIPNANEVDALGIVSGKSLANRIYQAHRAALIARRERDLISEKLLLHIDGSGDLQWADIFFGQRVEIPRDVSEYRKTENILRIIVDNAIAYHTTMPLRYFVESTPDRRAREQASIDALWANNLAQIQDLNGLFAEVMYMAMPMGFCPAHGYWRDDVTQDWYEPVAPVGDEQSGGDEGQFEGEAQGTAEVGLPTEQPEPVELSGGMLDCFVGNPFGTTFNRGATRSSVAWCCYERLLSADRVREHFGHIPGVDRLEGTTKIPSAATFQRIAKDWMMSGLGIHGDPTIKNRRGEKSDEELIVVLCREEAPAPSNGMLGRMQMIGLPGSVDVRQGGNNTSGIIMLADQPLPGGDWSWTNFYSHHRGNDIHGKPWVEDLDQIQVDLNIALSKRWEITNKMAEAPIVTPGGAISEDMTDFGGYNLLELEPSLGAWRPRVMEWPQSILVALDKEVAEKRAALYTIGGYQAASRGESAGSRQPYRAIVALQQADNTIHGPVNMRFRRSGCDFMRKMWSQMKMYGSVPWLMTVTGDESAHLVNNYVDNTKLSDTPPPFKLVNSFGASPEMHAQEILELVAIRGADGVPFLRTDEARRQYPNPMIFDDAGNPNAVRRRRAKHIQAALYELVKDFREQTGFMELDPLHPWTAMAAQQVFMVAEKRYPRLRDDDLEAHIATLSEITQDEQADPILRSAAAQRQDLYYQWQAQMAAQSALAMAEQQAKAGGLAPRNGLDPRQIAAEMGGRGSSGGTTLQDVGQ